MCVFLYFQTALTVAPLLGGSAMHTSPPSPRFPSILVKAVAQALVAAVEVAAAEVLVVAGGSTPPLDWTNLQLLLFQQWLKEVRIEIREGDQGPSTKNESFFGNILFP
jgi:hypothetical protein